MNQQREPQVKAAETTESETDFQKLMREPVGFGAKGIEINDSDDLHRCASFIFHSKIAPKDMNTVGAIMIAISLGAELGMKPMSAVQNIAVINGRPSIWGDAMLGICRQSGIFSEQDFLEWEEEVEGRGLTAFCRARRLPDGLAIERSFSMADAEKANLLTKNTPWKTYPGRMRMFRARSWCLRDTFGDILSGMRAAEEQQDCEPTETSAATRSHIEQFEKARSREPEEAMEDDDAFAAREPSVPAVDVIGSPERAAENEKDSLGLPAGRGKTAAKYQEATVVHPGDIHHELTDPPADPLTPEEAQSFRDKSGEFVSREDAATLELTALLELLDARLVKAVSFDNIDKVESDAVELCNRGELDQKGSDYIADKIADARARMKG